MNNNLNNLEQKHFSIGDLVTPLFDSHQLKLNSGYTYRVLSVETTVTGTQYIEIFPGKGCNLNASRFVAAPPLPDNVVYAAQRFLRGGAP